MKFSNRISFTIKQNASMLALFFPSDYFFCSHSLIQFLSNNGSVNSSLS